MHRGTSGYTFCDVWCMLAPDYMLQLTYAHILTSTRTQHARTHAGMLQFTYAHILTSTCTQHARTHAGIGHGRLHVQG